MSWRTQLHSGYTTSLKSPSAELSSLDVICSRKDPLPVLLTVQPVCRSELCSSELSCVEWLVQHDISRGKDSLWTVTRGKSSVDSRYSVTVPQSRSASLPFTWPSPTGGTNTGPVSLRPTPTLLPSKVCLSVFSECKPLGATHLSTKAEYFNVWHFGCEGRDYPLIYF